MVTGIETQLQLNTTTKEAELELNIDTMLSSLPTAEQLAIAATETIADLEKIIVLSENMSASKAS
jgi:hypothetical protein